MCMVSMITDYGRTTIQPSHWTVPVWNEYKEILDRLKKLDDKLDQLDCEDPAKAAWMKEVDDRLNKLEK